VRWIIGIFALIIAASGWHYAFHSVAASQLAVFEQQEINRRRTRLRRAAGVAMIAMAICFFLGFERASPQDNPSVFVGLWVGVMILLAAIVWLAMLDLRLTRQLRESIERKIP
jgi:hypothetical protein